MPIPCWYDNLHWITRGVVAGKLRLHPADEPDPVAPAPERRPFARCGKKILIALAIGAGVGLLTKLHFVSTRFYRAEGRVAIREVSEAGRAAVMAHHLSNLQRGQDKGFTELMRQGRAAVFASDDQTISVTVSDSDGRRARDLAAEVVQGYAARAIEQQAIQNRKMTGDQAKVIAIYRKLQNDRSALKEQADAISGKLPKEELGEYLGKVAGRMQSRIGVSDELVGQMNRINADIQHYRGEIVHPTITIDQQRLDQMKNVDRRYHGDHLLLTGKHSAYVASLTVEMDGLGVSLDELRGHLRAASAAVGKQLELKLPPELSDDLLEMSLAVDKYDGQVARFRERWDRYRAKLLEMIAEPASADFDGFQTLLSQLRQDLQQRCSQMPAHLEGLYNQLRQGQQGRGGLSGLTARNVACSAVAGELEGGLESWRKVTLHMNRLFPDGNVNLLTLGRVCRSIQWRLNFREKQLRQELEEQQMIACKREAQVKVDALQKEFEEASEGLVASFGGFSQDQQAMVQISREWPKLEKVRQAIGLIDREMASIEGELNSDPAHRIGQEKIEVLPVITRECNYAGIGPSGENGWAMILGLAGMMIAAGVMMPGEFKAGVALGARFVGRKRV